MHVLTVEQEKVESLPADLVNDGEYMTQVRLIIQKAIG